MAGIDDAPAACRTCAFLVKCFVQDSVELSERPAVVPEDWFSHPAQWNGVVTRVIRAAGAGIPVVLVHGEGGNADRWIWNLNALARAGYDVHAPDLPQHGFARTGDTGAASTQLHADFIGACLEEIGRPAILIGASSSANVVARVALDHPDLVAGLVMVAGGPLAYGEGPRERMKRLAFYRSREGGRERLRRTIFDPRLTTPSLVEQEFRFMSLPGRTEHMQALAQYLGDCLDDDLPSQTEDSVLAGIPTLVVWGGRDRIIPLTFGQDLVDHFGPNWRLAVMPDAGHLPNYEAPGRFNQEILGFAAGLSRPSAAARDAQRDFKIAIGGT